VLSDSLQGVRELLVNLYFLDNVVYRATRNAKRSGLNQTIAVNSIIPCVVFLGFANSNLCELNNTEPLSGIVRH